MASFTVANVGLGLAGAYVLMAPNPLQTLPRRITAMPQQAVALPAVLDTSVFNPLQQLLLYIGGSIALVVLRLLQPKAAPLQKQHNVESIKLDASSGAVIRYSAVNVFQQELVHTAVPASKQQEITIIPSADLHIRTKKPYYGPLPSAREVAMSASSLSGRRSVLSGLNIDTGKAQEALYNITIPRALGSGSSTRTEPTDSDAESTSTAPTSPATSERAEEDDYLSHWYANTRCYENGNVSLIYDPAACMDTTKQLGTALIIITPRVPSASGLTLEDVSPDPSTPSLAWCGELQDLDFASISSIFKPMVPTCTPVLIDINTPLPSSATVWEQHAKSLPTSSSSIPCAASGSEEPDASSKEDTDESTSAVPYRDTYYDVSTSSAASLEKSSLSDEDDDECAPASPYYDTQPNSISISPTASTVFSTNLQKTYETLKTQLLTKKEREFLKSVAKTRKKGGRAAKGLTTQVVAWTVKNRVRIVSADEEVKLWATAQLETEREWERKDIAAVEPAISAPLPPTSSVSEINTSDITEVDVVQVEQTGQEDDLEELKGPFAIDQYNFTTLLERAAGMSRPELYIYVARLLLYATLSPYMSEKDEVRSHSLLHFIDFATSCSVGRTPSGADSEEAKSVIKFWVRLINYVLQPNIVDPNQEGFNRADVEDYLSILPMLLRLQGNHKKASLVAFASYLVSSLTIRGLGYYAAQIYLCRIGRLESDARMYEEFLSHVGCDSGAANEDLVTLMMLDNNGSADFSQTFDAWYHESFYGGHGRETEPYQDDLLSGGDLFYGGRDRDTEPWSNTLPLSDAERIRTKYAILNIHNRYDFAAWQICYLMLMLDQVLQGYRVWFETARHSITSEEQQLAADKIEEVKTRFGTLLRMRAESIPKMDRVIQETLDAAKERDHARTRNLELNFQVPPAADTAHEKRAAQLFALLPLDAQQRLNEVSSGLWEAYETHEYQLENQVSAIESRYSKIFSGALSDKWPFDDILALSDHWDESIYHAEWLENQSERTNMLSRCFKHYYQQLLKEVDAVTVMLRMAPPLGFPALYTSTTSGLSGLASQTWLGTSALPKKQTPRSRFFEDGQAV